WKWRYVSLASIIAAAAMPVIVTLVEHKSLIALMAILIATVVIQRHGENIERIKNGTESRFKA
ncbi:MAG TPA: glycerol-3-phosphate acyltransferase, partial [Geobacteraceae bacterium]|nr:glycerol-3-phosphate acyltransferase [Geobacteraceae bacterium]